MPPSDQTAFSTPQPRAPAQEINLIGKSATFWIYAFVGVLATGFIWLRVPETKGKSLEQIEDDVRGRPEQAA